MSPLKILAYFFVCRACLFVKIPYNNLAEVLRRQEKYETAEEMHRWALEGREKALRLEHPFTLAASTTWREIGESMKRRRIWIDEHGKEERRYWVSSIQNLEEVLQDQGKCEAAERDTSTSIGRT
jgi:Tetratricopeptide repeat